MVYLDGLTFGNVLLQSPRTITPTDIKVALGEDHTESIEETYDIYLLPPGEDPESCQSYLRMRNREGKYNLMFEVCNLLQWLHKCICVMDIVGCFVTRITSLAHYFISTLLVVP